MQRSTPFLIALLGASLTSVSVADQRAFYPTNYFKSKEFRDAFLGTLGVKTDVEPKISEEEQNYLSQIEPFLSEDADACIRAYQKLVTPESTARFEYELGVLYLQKGQIEEARDWMLKAVTKFDNFLRAHTNLGMLYTRLNKTKEAIPHITKALALGQTNEQLFGMLAYCHLQNGDPLSAESAYRNAIMLGPKTVDWKTGLAQALFAQQKAAEAIALLDELLKQQPDKELFWSMQALAYLANQQPMKAAQNLETLAMMDAATAKDYSTLADIYLSESIYPLAGQAYINSLTAKNAPATAEGPLRSAEMLAVRAAYPQAQQLLDAIEKHFTEMPQTDRLKALKIRSRIATALEATDQAVAILKEVIQTDPLDGEALLLLANHYQSEGSAEDLVQSVFYLERAIKVPSVEAEAGVRLAQALVVKSSTDPDKAKKIESLQRAVDLLKRSQDLKKRESVGKYLADLEKALQKTKGM